MDSPRDPLSSRAHARRFQPAAQVPHEPLAAGAWWHTTTRAAKAAIAPGTVILGIGTQHQPLVGDPFNDEVDNEGRPLPAILAALGEAGTRSGGSISCTGCDIF